jgi:hypothetical protein
MSPNAAAIAAEGAAANDLTVEMTSTLSGQPGPTSTRFVIGDRVVVSGTGIGLRARYPDPSSASWQVMPDGATGTVVGGPVWSTGYFRWQIRYDSLPTIDTWSAEGEPDTNEFFLRNLSTTYPTITSIWPGTLLSSSSAQLITITGSNFIPSGNANASSLIFYDPANTSYARTPFNVTSTSMQYNIKVGSATGLWKVRVVNGGVESQLYSFWVSAVPPPDESVEPNDVPAQATAVAVGIPATGLIFSPTDVDWFKVTVTTGGRLNLTLDVPSGLDYELELYGSNFAWLAGSYNQAGANEAIQMDLASGDYYVRVYGFPDGNGAYSQSQPYQLMASTSVALPPGPLTGQISSAVMWAGVVEITGDVTIAPGGSLTILPGTEVRCPKSDDQAGGKNVNVPEIILDGGTLTAVGAAGSPIVFTSSKTPTKAPGDWYGIRIKSGNVALENCVVEYAVEGIRFEDTDTRFDIYSLSGVTVRRCSGNGVWTTSGQYAQPVVLNNFLISTNATGIRANGPVTVNGGEIRENTGNGAYAYRTMLVMDGATVRFNSSDGVYSDQAGLDMIGCTVSQNNGWGINGSWASSSGVRTAELEDNVVQTNGGGIQLYYSVTVGLVGNTISGNSGTGLNLQLNNNWGSAGVSASGITGNSIFGNGGTGVVIGGNSPPVLTLSGNDIYNNTSFELRNESAIAVVASNMYLGTEIAAEFGTQTNLTRIYDQADHPAYGQVLVQDLNPFPMLAAPAITSQPQGSAAQLGSTVTLTVTATGSNPITYQWYRNGTPIAQATGTSLVLANFDVSKVGAYHVRATNYAGYATSNIAQVTAILPPNPTVEPAKVELGRYYGHATIAVRGEVGRAYTIQMSEDLIHWVDFHSLILTENPEVYLDWQSLNKTQRFYRVRYSED